MNVALLGPPGSGKGTQAVRLSRKLGIVHISTGEFLRTAVRDQSPLGIKAEEFMKKGQLVPDDVMIGIVKERISRGDCSAGFLLDGFPRTIPQARMLDDSAAGQGPDKASERASLDLVISLELAEETCVRRLADRRTCPKDGLSFNPVTNPPAKSGKCDRCGTDLILREDDKPETVRERLKIYNEITQPLVDYYQTTHRLAHVDSSPSPDVVFKNLVELVQSEIPL